MTRAYKGIAPNTPVVTLNLSVHVMLAGVAGQQAVGGLRGQRPEGAPLRACARAAGSWRQTHPCRILRPEPGVVDGWLVRSRPGPGVEPFGVEGVTVWVETPGGRMASRTGPQGQFRLTGVPAGSWTVEFQLGGREAAVAQANVASPDRCATVLAIAEPVPR